MQTTDELTRFVREALAGGRSREEIAAALTRVGWADPEVEEALGAWGDGGALPPVPLPRPAVSAREGFSYGLLFVALGVVAWHLAALAFAVIDAAVPDPAQTGGSGYARSSMRWSIAALVVFTPAALWMGRRVERGAAATGRRRSGVRQTLGHAALLVVALVLLGDALAIVYAWLSGDLSARFALKAAAVAAIAGAIFAYVRAMTREDSHGRR